MAAEGRVGVVRAGILATLRGRMWRVRHLPVLAAVVGAGAIISACGGDSTEETSITVPTTQTSGTELTKAEFIAQADAACAEANAAIERFAAAGQGVTEADQIAQLRQGVVDQLNELGPPAEDKATLDQFLTALQAQVAAGQKIAAAERGEDLAEFEAELDTAKDQAETAAPPPTASRTADRQIDGSSGASPSTAGSGAGEGNGGSVTPSAPSTPLPPTGGPTDRRDRGRHRTPAHRRRHRRQRAASGGIGPSQGGRGQLGPASVELRVAAAGRDQLVVGADSAIRPCSSTAIRSAPRIVERRWAITIAVRPPSSRSSPTRSRARSARPRSTSPRRGSGSAAPRAAPVQTRSAAAARPRGRRRARRPRSRSRPAGAG